MNNFYQEYGIEKEKLTRDYLQDPLKKREQPNKDDLAYLYTILSIKELNQYFQKTCIDNTIKKFNITISKELSNKKRERTNLKKYGHSYLCNRKEHRQKLNEASRKPERINKIKQTCLEKYGVTNYTQTKEYKEKTKQTCLEKYGVDNFNKTTASKEKVKQTCLEKYGVKNISQCTHIKKQKIQTALKHNPEDPFNSKKRKETCLKKYGVEYHSQTHLSQEILNLFQDKELFKNEIDNFNGNIIEMAIHFNVGFSTIYNYIKRHELEYNYKTKNKSIYEDLLISYFPDENIQTNVRLLNNKEIDIFFSDYKFGIEFNGNYWHSEIYRDKKYHYNKSQLAKENNIFLYHIFEYEWLKKPSKIISHIRSLIGINKHRIYARKCIIKEINNDIKKEFLNNYHLQGNDNSSIRLGLFYNDELLSVMTFGKSRYNKNYEYELHRYCCKFDYSIIGGASKLFKYFLNKYDPNSVISYCNIHNSKGDWYKILGFELSHISSPNYVWCNSKGNIKTRYQCQRHKLKENGSEKQIMQSKKYFRIYDCGNYVWVYKKRGVKNSS